MAKFHVTRSGKTEPCGATVRACPLGGANHFGSLEEAVAYSLSPTFAKREVYTRVQSEARRMAENAAGRKLAADNVWIESSSSGVQGEYQVRYTVPKEEGFHIAQLPLFLDRDEFEDWESVKEERN
ncbi:hypothetical protein [Microbacterium sp. KR10-403]|uniref:hypothetical protein n=1 Tax=Microbacterium sp. KR10-403 TaxID=3158581 RepID=UPI0032E441C2